MVQAKHYISNLCHIAARNVAVYKITACVLMTSSVALATYDHDLYNDRISYPEHGISLPVPKGWRSYRVESLSNILAEYQHVRRHTSGNNLSTNTTPHARSLLLTTSADDIDIHLVAAIDHFPSSTMNFAAYVKAQANLVSKYSPSQRSNRSLPRPYNVNHPVYDMVYDIFAIEINDRLQCFVNVRPDTVLIFTLTAKNQREDIPKNQREDIPIYLQYIIDHMVIEREPVVK